MHIVTVLNYDGNPLTGCRPKRARKLMKAKKARPAIYNGAFAIQLNRKSRVQGMETTTVMDGQNKEVVRQ